MFDDSGTDPLLSNQLARGLEVVLVKREQPVYVLDDAEKLVATVSLRDLVVAEPQTLLRDIMNRKVIRVEDYDRIDSLGEIISKYNLIAIPVVDEEEHMTGIVIIDDVVFTLMKARKRVILKED